MNGASRSDRLRELLVPRIAVDWIARLLIWCGGTFALFVLVKSTLGLPVDFGLDFVVIFLASAPILALSMLVHRQTDRDLSQMTDHALTDPLTGLMNRRAFHAAVATADPGAILIIDIDHFKYVNDRYGHAAGDEVLRAMAGHLRSQTRQGDLVARLGGEEFALYVPDCDSMEVDAIGGRLCRGFVLYNRRVPAPIKITMSVGAAYSLMSDGTEALFRNADQALYQAKRSGRARLAFWQPPVASRY